MNTQQAKRTATSQYVKDSAGCQSPGHLGGLKRLGISGKCPGSTDAMESVSNSSLRRRWLSLEAEALVVFKSVAPCQAMRLGAKPSSRISKATAKELTNLHMPKGELNPLQGWNWNWNCVGKFFEGLVSVWEMTASCLQSWTKNTT